MSALAGLIAASGLSGRNAHLTTDLDAYAWVNAFAPSPGATDMAVATLGVWVEGTDTGTYSTPGVVAASGLSGRHARLTTDLDTYAWVNEFAPSPFVCDMGARTPLSQVDSITHHHVGGGHQPGYKARFFVDDWYDRFHWAPRRVDFGLVTSPRSAPVLIWNAWLGDRALVGLTGQVEGLSLDAPLVFRGLSEHIIRINIASAGPSSVDTRYSPVFDNGDTTPIHVLASRQAIAWFFAPNWVNGINERLAWATDILQSESMVEQRRALRTAPRREFDVDFVVSGRDRQRLDIALGGVGAKVWVAPVWYDVQHLAVDIHTGELHIPCSTIGHAFRVGNTAILVSQDARDIVRIAAISPVGLTIVNELARDWPAGTRLYPGMSVRLTGEPVLNRQSDNLYTFSASFIDVDPLDVEPIAPPVLYRGRPVLEQHPNEAEPLTRQFARLVATLDSGLAAAAQLTDVGKRAMPMLAWRWIGAGLVERDQYRALLYWLAGRCRALWVPPWAEDLTLVAQLGAIDITIDIAACGYSLHGFNRPGRRDIRIELRHGEVFYRHITAAFEMPGDIERLTLDAPFGRLIAPTDVTRISWLVLSRGDSDEVAVEHMTDAEGVARSEIIFRGVRDDEF